MPPANLIAQMESARDVELSPRQPVNLWLLLALVAAAAMAVVIFNFWITKYIPSNSSTTKELDATAFALRGQFGDMFGALNSFFSACAFSGIIYTILLQRTELHNQRIELQQTREELRRSAIAQEQSKEIFDKQMEVMKQQLDSDKKATQFQNYISINEYLQQDFRRADRAHVMKMADSPVPLEQWEADDRLAVERVCGSFNFLGTLIEYEMVPAELALREYGYSASRCLVGSKPLLEYMRQKYNQNYWSGIDNIVSRHGRAK